MLLLLSPSLLARRGPLLLHYPKSGATWVRLLILTAVNGAAITSAQLPKESPPLTARPRLTDIRLIGERNSSLRHSHYSARMLQVVSGRGRVFELVRNPLDIAASYVTYLTHLQGHVTNIDEIVASFVNGSIDRYGSWSEHVESALAADIPILRYEDFIERPEDALRHAVELLEIDVPIDRDAIRRSVEICTPNNTRFILADSPILRSQGWVDPAKFVARAQPGGHQQTLSDSHRTQIAKVFGSVSCEIGY